MITVVFRRGVVRRAAGVVVLGAVLSGTGVASVAAQVTPPVSGAAGAATTCILAGVDSSACVDIAVASVNQAPPAVPGLPRDPGGDMRINRNGGSEVEHD